MTIPTHFDLPGLEVTHLRDGCHYSMAYAHITLWLRPILLDGYAHITLWLHPYYSMVTPILLYGYAHITLWLRPYDTLSIWPSWS